MDNLGELLQRLTLLSFLEEALYPPKGEGVTTAAFAAAAMGQPPAGADPSLSEEELPVRAEHLPLGDAGTERIGSASPAYIENRLERVAAPTLSAEEISRYFERDARRYG